MRVRKISMLTLAAVAVGLSLTACDPTSDPQPGDSASSSVSGTVSPGGANGSEGSTRSPDGSGDGESASGASKEPGVSCTDQLNYAGDSRSNAEINSIGEDTGTCPPVQQQ
ncbi:hypothetical protein ACLVWQ_27930 [Streptomyces sp. CWNU-52B]|uniref:hypothetical protein n=1 Tax=unclassified Streptomyces TaxID=2593676 RepID=UPI0039C10563